jgi:serine/threonine-protein kinase
MFKAVPLLMGAVLWAACGGGADSGQGSPSPSGPIASGELTTFHSEEEGFSIGYPPDWTRQEGAFGSVVAFADAEHASGGFAPNVNVVVEELPSSDISQDQYTEAALAQLKNFITNLDNVEQNPSQLAGQPATEVTYTGTQGTSELRWLQVYTVAGDRAFVLTFTALPEQFDSVEPMARQMFASFAIE